MKHIHISYDPRDCGIDDGGDLYAYLVNELDAHRITARIQEVRGPKQIQRIRNVNKVRAPSHAIMARDMLRNALEHAKLAGACCTAARIRYAISSAKGAVRAAQYRQARGRA